MFPTRQFAAPTALSLIAGALFFLLFSGVDARAEQPIGRCDDAAELAVLASPLAPWKGAPLRVVFAAEKPIEGELSLIAPDGKIATKSAERHGGPPYFWFAEVAKPAAGTWRATLANTSATGGAHDHARHRRERRQAAAAPCDVGKRLAGTQHVESRERKPVSPHGSRSSSTRRSTPRLHGKRCMRCCAINPAMSCTIIWVSAKTRWISLFAPTAPTFRISCARISRSRWGCRSATRSARAAAAASRRSAPRGGTSRRGTSSVARRNNWSRPVAAPSSDVRAASRAASRRSTSAPPGTAAAAGTRTRLRLLYAHDHR